MVSLNCWSQKKDSISDYKLAIVKNMDSGGIENQGRTGTCWAFAGLSFLQSELFRRDKAQGINLSEMFVARKIYPLKAEKFYRTMGKTKFGQGGMFSDVLLCLKEYGVIPQDVYDGNRQASYDHGEMKDRIDSLSYETLKPTSQKAKRRSSLVGYKREVDSLLRFYMKGVPEQFEYKGKKYTPASFTKFLGLNANDYISITSFSHHPFYKPFALEVPDNWNWTEAYNVPLTDLLDITKHTLLNGYTVAWAADISNSGYNISEEKVAVVPKQPWENMTVDEQKNMFLKPMQEKQIDQQIRQLAFDSFETTDDHAMHITGLVKDQTGKIFFRVKDSLGKDRHDNGYFNASEAYFALNTTCIMVNKNALPKAIKMKLRINK
jgi:bleomycin hydrolase